MSVWHVRMKVLTKMKKSYKEKEKKKNRIVVWPSQLPIDWSCHEGTWGPMLGHLLWCHVQQISHRSDYLLLENQWVPWTPSSPHHMMKILKMLILILMVMILLAIEPPIVLLHTLNSPLFFSLLSFLCSHSNASLPSNTNTHKFPLFNNIINKPF